MRADVQRDLSRSARAFVRHVWPTLKDSLGGGDLLPIEHPEAVSLFAHDLDVLAGADYWLIRRPGGMQRLATRCQVTPSPYRTWTIRIGRDDYDGPTELERLLCREEHSYLKPDCHIQAYLRSWDGPIICAATIASADLRLAVMRALWAGPRSAQDRDGSVARFIYVFWEQARMEGLRVKIIDV